MVDVPIYEQERPAGPSSKEKIAAGTRFGNKVCPLSLGKVWRKLASFDRAHLLRRLMASVWVGAQVSPPPNPPCKPQSLPAEAAGEQRTKPAEEPRTDLGRGSKGLTLPGLEPHPAEEQRTDLDRGSRRTDLARVKARSVDSRMLRT